MFKLPQYLRKKLFTSNVKYNTKKITTEETQKIIIIIEWNPIFGMSFKTVELKWTKDKHYLT